MRLSLAGWLAQMQRKHPTTIALGLERVLTVARRMGLDRTSATVITVGGTNGKGSCIAVMERILLEGGARVGCYSSPHLVRYNERVRIRGQEARDEELCSSFTAVEEARAEVPLTFFEFGTLAALELFRRADCDWLLLEVGLGGRLDAVNIIDADVAVVTSIAIDHTDWLGRDRRSIGLEKAGIFRHGHPAICGDRDPPMALRAVADVLAAPWHGIGETFDQMECGQGWHWRGCLADGTVLHHQLERRPTLHADDVACALQALALTGALPARELLQRVLPRITLPGRMQKRPLGAAECLLDVAHNPAGIACLAEHLRAEPVPGRTWVLFGAMRDKDADGMLRELLPLADRWIIATLAEERAAPPDAVRAALHGICEDASVETAASVAAGMEAAAAAMNAGDRLVVCGSFHVVGPALEWLDAQEAAHGERT